MKSLSAAASSLLVLGSGSSTRKLILSEMGLQFEVHKPDIDEKAIRYADPVELVLALGKAKAAALLHGPQSADFAARSAFLLTGDQVVVWDGQILEKPESEEEARRFIEGYGALPPKTVGSCVVTDAVTGEQWSAVDEATIYFEPIPQAAVDALIAAGDVYYCAGGLMVEHPLVEPHVKRIDGTIDSVMGLKKETVQRLLEAAHAARAERTDST
ncbi:hypothetical protein AB1Y20_017406 [Prymnesium parvum]|uniref:Maf-like protein n=1 Tax=Prymnesium parvum TaxID=97485 RepID=A0AB34JM20_PRYPA